MDLQKETIYKHTRRTIWTYLSVLLGIAIILGVLHYFFSDIKVGRISWFDLDKERNISTWFSGSLFFLMGCAAFVAYCCEKKQNAGNNFCFKFPILWVGIGLTGFFLSLDEITVLHENVFWKEIRFFSEKLGNQWIYMTQWQILFAPAITLILAYFAIFLSFRLKYNRLAIRNAFAAIACWIVALTLEGIRGTFKLKGKLWYSFETLIEEELEMIGIICMLASIIFYTIDIALNPTFDHRKYLKSTSRFCTRQIAIVLVIILFIVSSAGGVIYYFAQKQASIGAPMPHLYKKAGRKSIGYPKEMNIATKNLKAPASGRQSQDIWFDDIQGRIALSDPDKKALVRFAENSISGIKISRNSLPATLSKDTSPRIVFLSMSDGITPAKVVMGAGKGTAGAIEQATSRMHNLFGDNYHPKYLKLDVVRDIYVKDNVNIQRPTGFELSLQGIAFDKESGIAFLPEKMAANGLVNSNQTLQTGNIQNYLKDSPLHREQFQRLQSMVKIKMYYFTAISFFSDGNEIVNLYRGHRVYNQVSKQGALLAASRGGRYLAGAVDYEGKFSYIYYPQTDSISNKYNILRHAGAIYAMLELYEATGEMELLDAAHRAIKYLLSSVKPCQTDKGNTDCIVENGHIKLGGNALAVIALAKYIEITHDQQYMPVLLRLGKWIRKAQRDNGEFYIQKQTYPEGKIIDFMSEYYPGEAILAMTRIYALDTDEAWLDTAEKGAEYLINVRDKGLMVSELVHDHWLLYALNGLYRQRSNPLYLKHALRIASSIIQSQNRVPLYSDWLGSFYIPPRSTPTATRTEGLCAAYYLARDFARPQEANSILESIRLGIAFQLQTQFRPESVLYFKNPKRALGGFHRSLTNSEIRIDYVQHNISSLLGYYRIIGNIEAGQEETPTIKTKYLPDCRKVRKNKDKKIKDKMIKGKMI